VAQGAGRGWGAILALTLAAAVLSVVHTWLLILVPLALLLIALPPWRPGLVLLGLALGYLALPGDTGDPVANAERGWVLLLGAWFVVAVVVRPAATFMSRALMAVAATVVTAAGVLAMKSGAWAQLDWEIGRRLRAGTSDVLALLTYQLGADPAGSGLVAAGYQAVQLQTRIYPALLALASVAGLAVAWWIYRRLQDRESRPLAPLREFRFSDELIWAFILGVVLVAFPLGEAAVRLGANMLAFTGVLYALRGVAVILALAGAPGIGWIVFAALAVIFMYPLVMAATFVVGLTDTWLDLRSRRVAAGPGS